MARILSLDTSTKVCSVAVHEDGVLIGSQSYYLQKSHSNLLPVIIKELMANCEFQMKELDAVAISAGPGSYTGLRIGTATAKGLAFSLDLPLIAVNTLDTMIPQVVPIVGNERAIYGPMIDARRMEVYCKLVDHTGMEIWGTRPLIVDESTFSEFTQDLYLFGNGSGKLKALLGNSKVRFVDHIDPKAEFMGSFAHEAFLKKKFEDVAYFEPDYLKEYRTNTPTNKFSV